MLKNYNKLAILSVILLVCAVLVLAVGFPLLEWLTGKVIHDYDFLKNGKYVDILADFLLITFYASLLASVITGIMALFKIRKTKGKGEIIAVFSAVISALWFLGSLYAGWGLW